MNKYSCQTSMLDLLWNMLLAFIALFIIAFVLMNQDKSKKNSEIKAEFIVTVTWPDTFDDDVDTYVSNQAGLVFFGRREDGLMNLDRDDRGNALDSTETKLGKIQYKDNVEMVAIRGIIPGEYCINIHMYEKRSKESVPVYIKLEKLNPSIQLIAEDRFILDFNGHELTFLRFTLDKEGNVVSTSKEFKKLAQSRVPYNGEF